MQREERLTQDLVDEALAESLSSDVQPEQAEPPDAPEQMGNLKFIGVVAAEILGHLP